MLIIHPPVAEGASHTQRGRPTSPPPFQNLDASLATSTRHLAALLGSRLRSRDSAPRHPCKWPNPSFLCPGGRCCLPPHQQSKASASAGLSAPSLTVHLQCTRTPTTMTKRGNAGRQTYNTPSPSFASPPPSLPPSSLLPRPPKTYHG